MVDSNKLKGFSMYLPIPFYWYVKERAQKCNVSMSIYIQWLISQDIELYKDCKEVTKDVRKN